MLRRTAVLLSSLLYTPRPEPTGEAAPLAPRSPDFVQYSPFGLPMPRDLAAIVVRYAMAEPPDLPWSHSRKVVHPVQAQARPAAPTAPPPTVLVALPNTNKMPEHSQKTKDRKHCVTH